MRYLLVLQLEAYGLGFNHLKSMSMMRTLYESCKQRPKRDYLLEDGYLLKGTRLCVLRCGTKELLIREVYKGALASHYEENKITPMLKEHYF